MKTIKQLAQDKPKEYLVQIQTKRTFLSILILVFSIEIVIFLLLANINLWLGNIYLFLKWMLNCLLSLLILILLPNNKPKRTAIFINQNGNIRKVNLK